MPNKNIWSINSTPDFGKKSNEVLMKMGKYMEKMMQLPAHEFRKKFLIQNTEAQDLPPVEEDYYNYSSFGNFLMRS